MAGPTPAAAGPPDTSTSAVRGRSSPRPDRRAIAAASHAVTPSPQAPLSTRPERALSGRRDQTPLCINSNPNIVVLPTQNLVGDSFEALSAKQFLQGPVSLASQRVKNNFDLRCVKDNVDHIRGANRLSLEDAMRVPDDQDIMLLIPADTYVANGKKWRPLPLPHRWLEHDTISSRPTGSRSSKGKYRPPSRPTPPDDPTTPTRY